MTANWTQSYFYDRYGNRTNVTPAGVTANSQAVPSDGLASLAYDQPSNHINTPGYVYDLAGNLTRGQDAAGAWQKYEYDVAGRLYIVRDDGGNQLFANFYGTGRQRLASLNYNGNDYTLYAWGGSQVIAEYAVNAANFAAVSWRKIYIYAGLRLLSTFSNNNQGGETLEYQHPDRLGTKLITNNTANTSFEQSTLPFGTALDAETSGTTNQRFTSYDRSSVTGIDYAVNRSHSPAQGRFTSVDPIGINASSLVNPQSLNLYAYCGNDPVNHTDPNGLFWGKLFKGIVKVLTNKWVRTAIAVAAVVLSAGAAGPLIITNFATQTTAITAAGWATTTLSATLFAGGVGAIASNFASNKQSSVQDEAARKERIIQAAYGNALWRLLKKPKCAEFIKGGGFFDPAETLKTLQKNHKVYYDPTIAASGDTAVARGGPARSGPRGEIRLSDAYFDRSGSVGGWTGTLNIINTRTWLLLHELKHVTDTDHVDASTSGRVFDEGVMLHCFGVKMP